jgi:hypothetical protein
MPKVTVYRLDSSHPLPLKFTVDQVVFDTVPVEAGFVREQIKGGKSLLILNRDKVLAVQVEE